MFPRQVQEWSVYAGNQAAIAKELQGKLDAAAAGGGAGGAGAAEARQQLEAAIKVGAERKAGPVFRAADA